MGTRPGLFPPPDAQPPGLSMGLAADAHLRLRPGQTAKWAKIKVQLDCIECSLLQHETRGRYWPRRQAKHRRTHGVLRLDLCHSHAQLWRERDRRDSATPDGAA